jgi:hypothetical protein
MPPTNSLTSRRPGLKRLATREGQKTFGQRRGLLGAAHRIFENTGEAVVCVGVPAQGAFEIAHHDCQVVVKFVRDAGRETAERLHFGCMTEAIFKISAIGDVAQAGEQRALAIPRRLDDADFGIDLAAALLEDRDFAGIADNEGHAERSSNQRYRRSTQNLV